MTIASVPESELYHRAEKEGITTKKVLVKGSLSVLNLAKLFSFANYLKKEKIDVIFLNLSQDLKFGALAGKLAGVDKIIYRRGLAIPIKNRFYTKLLLKDCVTDIIANSCTIKRMVLENTSEWLNEDKIKIIYNGIKLDNIQDKLDTTFNIRKEFDLEDNIPIIANIGRLTEQKGHKYLIKAVDLIRREVKEFKVLVIGKGDLENKLKEEVKSFNLDDYIIFTGFRDDIYNILAQVDFLVHTALWEGCPNIILEAMAVATPVVATNISSVVELVLEGKTGYLAESQDVYDIAKQTVKMIEESNKNKMGQTAKDLINKKFDFKDKITELEDLYLR